MPKNPAYVLATDDENIAFVTKALDTLSGRLVEKLATANRFDAERAEKLLHRRWSDIKIEIVEF